MTGRSSGVDRRDSGSRGFESALACTAGAFPSPQSVGLATTSPDAGPSRRGAPPPLLAASLARARGARTLLRAGRAARVAARGGATPRRKDAPARLLDPVAVVTVARGPRRRDDGDGVPRVGAARARRPARSPEPIGALAPPSRASLLRANRFPGGGAPLRGGDHAVERRRVLARARRDDESRDARSRPARRRALAPVPLPGLRETRRRPPRPPPPSPPPAPRTSPSRTSPARARPPPSSRLWAAPVSCAPSAASPRRRISARPSPSPRARRR